MPSPAMFDAARTAPIPAKVEGLPYVSAPVKVGGVPATLYGWETPRDDEFPIVDFAVVGGGAPIEVQACSFEFGGRFSLLTTQGAEMRGSF